MTLRRDTSPEAIERARQKHAESVKRWQEKQRKPMPKVNKARKARRKRAGEVYGPGYVWIAQQRCEERGNHGCVYFDHRRPEAHHLKTVGAGGRDAKNLIPCCHALHDEFEAKPLSEMEAKYGKDYRTRAEVWWARYLTEGA